MDIKEEALKFHEKWKGTLEYCLRWQKTQELQGCNYGV